MAGKGIQDLVGQVMIDKEFLADLMREPARILANFELTAEERAVLAGAGGGHLQQRLAHGRQRRADPAGHWQVVEADHAEVLGDAQAGLTGSLVDAERLQDGARQPEVAMIRKVTEGFVRLDGVEPVVL